MGEIDIAVRHVARRRPHELAGPFVGAEARVTGWLDTQLTTLERRIDKALCVETEAGLSLLHVEVEAGWSTAVDMRVFEYVLFLLVATHDAAREAPRPVRSVVLLLQGREDGYDHEREVAFHWPGAPFSGLRYRLEQVYLQRVEELLARPPLWWIFVALAIDADVEAVRRVLQLMEEHVHNETERADLITALAILADHDGRERGLGEAIARLIPDEVVMQSTLGQRILERGRDQGRREDRRDAILEVLEARGLPVDETLRGRLATIDDLETLGRLHVRAVQISDVDELFVGEADEGEAAPSDDGGSAP